MSFSPGTDGTGPERYVASLPFELSSGSVVQLPENAPAQVGLGGSLKFERLHHLYALSLGSFPSPEEAETGLVNLKAAALWCAIEFGVGLRYAAGVQSPTLFEAPIPIPSTQPMAFIGQVTGWQASDGHYDAGLPVIRPDHKRLLRVESGRASVTAGISIDRFMAKVEEALLLPGLAAASHDNKLMLALEVALGHRFEVTDNARFISLVTSLEALTPERSVSASSMAAVAAAFQLTKTARDSMLRDDPEREAMDRLLTRIDKLKTDSIGEALRSFIDDVLQRNPTLGAREETRKRVVEAYSTRSRLLHDGYVEHTRLQNSLEFLRSFVPPLLQTMFRERVKPTANAA
ncbi:MAG: hypothetical protein IOC38_20050 [Burkholderia sp.]|uniref:hypothetical protein n=1 Tax=Burkholderia sp. TaxID=36773 RepID=UPI002584388C|nr:hypothetical protein [Burkholderia sp.]MCA3887338.1 hypothetical protein [Burkholderia sp.]